ncbi:MAG: ParA family protein [Syntrophales bacterium]
MVIAVINNKGGTGKTTTAVNVAAALAKKGLKVLLVDLDAQGSASMSLGIPFDKLTPSTAAILFDDLEIEQAIRNSEGCNLDLLTGGFDLASSDLVLADVAGRENKLRDCLAPLRHKYDFIFCDCPPSLSLLSINALVASDAYVLPVTAEYLALEGLVSMTLAVDEIKKEMGIHPHLLGICFAMLIRGVKSQREIVQLVRDEYGTKVFKTEIRRNVKLAEAPSFGKSIFSYAPRSSGAVEYAELAEEIRKRCRMQMGG